MRLGHGALAELIVKALTECGPMTSSETLLHIGVHRDGSHSVFQRLSTATTRRPQRIHVCGWTIDAEGQRTYPRRVYAVGPAPEGLKIRKPQRSTDRRVQYNRERYTRHKGASVFTWGWGQRKLQDHRTKVKEAA